MPSWEKIARARPLPKTLLDPLMQLFLFISLFQGGPFGPLGFRTHPWCSSEGGVCCKGQENGQISKTLPCCSFKNLCQDSAVIERVQRFVFPSEQWRGWHRYFASVLEWLRLIFHTKKRKRTRADPGMRLSWGGELSFGWINFSLPAGIQNLLPAVMHLWASSVLPACLCLWPFWGSSWAEDDNCQS